MDSGFYAACTGLMARADALELMANNMANVNTAGYKAQLEFYRAFEAASGGHPLSPLNQAVNNYGVLGGAAIDLRTGELEKTGNDLDLALEGAGFFVIKTAQGIRYTRNGSFHTDSQGRLLTAAGDAVMGEEGPIELPGGSISISADGTISQDGAVVASLKLVTFKPGTSLAAEGNSYYRAPADAELAADDPRLAQGSLESANLNPVAGGVALIALERHAQLLQQALAIFHTTFNGTAAQELSRVT